jgi:hypothetical protein
MFPATVVALLLTASMMLAAEDRLVVHEWGTFTTLQDEDGAPITGINTDDEPVPDFVHRLARRFFLSASEAPPAFFQGAPRCHPDVAMRLETPVLYFYPTAGNVPPPFEVRVRFRGGWLTEYFPAAEALAPGFDAGEPDRPFPGAPEQRRSVRAFGHLNSDASGELLWKGVKLGGDGVGPETDDPVWLAPRAVDAAMLVTDHGEREKFLFYRGVGTARAALQVRRDAQRQTLTIYDSASAPTNSPEGGMQKIPAAWLVHVQPDGTCAVRSAGELPPATTPRWTVPASFTAAEFSGENLSRLQGEMRAALVQAGLFADEAEALLRTWEVSYFKSPGLRLFYVCSDAEVDELLPLGISVPAKITRVMIGRVEIVTPEQRALLAKIAAGPSVQLQTMRGPTGDGASNFFKDPENRRRWHAVMSGRAPLRDLGLAIPEIYQAYLELGRFRNALLLDEAKRRNTPALEEFIETNQFGFYKIREPGR